MPATWLVVPFVVLAGACWLGAVVHWVLALRHLSGRTSVLGMLFRGYEMLNGDNFTDAGRVYRRRYLLCFAGFFGALLCIAAVATISGG